MTDAEAKGRQGEYQALASHFGQVLHDYLTATYGEEWPLDVILAGVSLLHSGCIKATLMNPHLTPKARLESVADALAEFTHNVVGLLGKHR